MSQRTTSGTATPDHPPPSLSTLAGSSIPANFVPTSSSMENGQASNASLMPHSAAASRSSSTCRAPMILQPETQSSTSRTPPRLSVCRLTVLNKNNQDPVLDHVRIEAHQHDTVEDVIQEICRAKKIRKKSSVRLLNYYGHELDAKSTLATSGLHDLAVVHLCASDTCSEPSLVDEVISRHNQKHLIPRSSLTSTASSTGTSPCCSSSGTCRRSCNTWLCLACFLLLVAACGLLAMSCLYVLHLVGILFVERNSIAIVLDAGSTSTKIHAYSWQATHRSGHITAGVKEVKNPVRTDKPLADFGTDGNGVNKVWEEIEAKLKDFTDFVPPERRNRTDVYLGATAGMRLLQESKPHLANDILNSVRDELKEMGFQQVQTHSDRIRILTAEEEALYGWISVNYIKGAFGKTENGVFKPHPQEETYGALDLGGASTQISFAVPGTPENRDSPDVDQVTLFNHTYFVYRKSFMCYGAKKIKERVMAMAALESGAPSNFTDIPHPCILRGAVKELPVKDVFNKHCTQGELARKIFGSELVVPLKWLRDDTKLVFRGTGNESKCQEYVRRLFPPTPCRHSSCSLQGEYQPPVRGNFYAFSAYYHAFSKLKAVPKGYLPEVRKQLSAFCHKESQTSNKDDYKDYYCLEANYKIQLLQTLGFSEDNWMSITFATKIGGVAMSWTLGYMLHMAHMLPEVWPTSTLPQMPFLGGLCVCLLLLLLGLCLCCWGVRIMRKRRKRGIFASEKAQEIHLIITEPV